MDARERGAFATLLRRLRQARGFTQQELAHRSGVSERSISDLEREINLRPHRDTAFMLADGLCLAGTERDEFLAEARRPPRLPLAAPPRTASLLPEPADALLGRDRELRAVEEAFFRNGVRLLTLTGPGGVGKTRLASEAARQLADRFADGVVFVRLDGLTDPALVLPTIAGALGLQETGGVSARDQLAAYLAQRDLLIVLDNLEHLLAASADLAALFNDTPRIRVIVTSREALRVRGEHVLTVMPLPRPELEAWRRSQPAPDNEGSPAIALFVRRALAVRPDLVVDPATPEGHANLVVIAEMCHRLDGLPLAIELAAAQAQVFSPPAILALLKSAGLPLLTGGGRDQPARLQTLDAAIAWSYDLLPPDEQALFRALSVFAGGFTMAAAAAVVAASGPSPNQMLGQRDPLAGRDPTVIRADSAEPALGQLIDQLDPVAGLDPATIHAMASLARRNMLLQDASAAPHAPSRFRMLEPLRLFALDRLRAASEERGVRERHARFFAGTAETLDALTLGPDPEVWLEQQVLDLDNFRAALDWAQAVGEDELLVRITAYIAQLWLIKGLHAEGRQRVMTAIAVDNASAPALRWYLRFWAGTFAIEKGDLVNAAAYARSMLEIAEASGDCAGVGVGLTLLSRAVGARPEGHEEAASLARRAVDTLAPLGQGEWTGWAWSRLGVELHRLGRLEEACDSLLESLTVRRVKQCEGCASYTLALLGAVLLDLGQSRAALDAYRECLALTIKHGNHSLTLAVLAGLADLAWRFGEGPDASRAAHRFFGASEALRSRHGIGWDPAGATSARHWLAVIRRAIGDDAADLYLAEGMALSHDEVADLAWCLTVSDHPRPSDLVEEAGSLFAALGSIE
jgi:predicted ATPase/DNA-binding XRE family transcriptional regulator